MGRLSRVFSTDPKVIARQFLWFGFAYLWIGGVMAMNLRWALAYPGRITPFLPFLYFRTGGRIGPMDYASLFTLHGTVMIFFAVSPLVNGWLGNLLVPTMTGARTMAFPRAGCAAFWCTLAGGLVLLTAMYLPYGGPAAGWTSYPPLSGRVGSPGPAQTFWCVAMLLVGIGTVLSAINFVATVIRLRAPGMHFFRLPLTVWGIFLASVLNVLFVPVLCAGTVLLLSDRLAGTRYFTAGMATPGAAGDPMIYQHLFWIFGHPEVYILILPVWGIVSDLLAVFARKPAFGYRTTVYAMMAVTALAALVYGHHLFTTGMSPILSQAFMALTLVISVPSAVFFFNWLATLWRGAIRFEPPMLYVLGALVVFALGGLTGMYLGTLTTDVYLHDTYFVVGHFHFVMAASLLFGAFAAIHYWFPLTFGRMLDARLARWHAGLTLVCMLGAFGGMLVLGVAGAVRRSFDPSVYTYLRPYAWVHRGVSHAAFTLFFVQGLFVFNLVRTLWRPRTDPTNPWQAATLEWSTNPSPVVHHGPHEYAHPTATRGDWVMQDEAQ